MLAGWVAESVIAAGVGAAIGVPVGLRRRRRRFSMLDASQLREAVRIVQRGEAVTDLALAPAVVTVALAVQRTRFWVFWFGFAAVAVVFALGSLSLVFGPSTSNPPALQRELGLVLVAGFLMVAVFFVLYGRRRRALAARAERAARALLEGTKVPDPDEREPSVAGSGVLPVTADKPDGTRPLPVWGTPAGRQRRRLSTRAKVTAAVTSAVGTTLLIAGVAVIVANSGATNTTPPPTSRASLQTTPSPAAAPPATSPPNGTVVFRSG